MPSTAPGVGLYLPAAADLKAAVMTGRAFS